MAIVKVTVTNAEGENLKTFMIEGHSEQEMAERLVDMWVEHWGGVEVLSPPQPKQQLVVHILFGGFALCGFSREMPRDWPEGHSWVGSLREEFPTCQRCIEIKRGQG